MSVGPKRLLELAVVLDDAVQDEGELALLAPGQRVGVLLGDPAVCRPASVAETGRRVRAVERGCFLELGEVADGADVLELVVLAEDEAR